MEKIYSVTWLHEVQFKANSDADAENIWQNIDLGKLDQEVDKNHILAHDFIDDRSFECVTDNYREVEF